MITFKQFLAEVSIIHVSKSEKLISAVGKNISTQKGAKKISTLRGYTISELRKEDFCTYFVSDADGKILSALETQKNGAAQQEKLVQADRSNDLPLPKVYAHLIKKFDLILMSDSLHTHGGYSIWKRLSKEPGIAIHGWDGKKAINLGNYLDQDTELETHVDGTGDTEDSDITSMSDADWNKISNVTLIAHKK